MPTQSSWVDFRSVKQVVTMIMVLGHYGVKGLRKNGSELRGRCPIHEGEHPDSFHVNIEKNCFQCFAGSCGKRGNILDFVAAMEQCSVRDAALKIQEWFSLTPNKMEGGARSNSAAPTPKKPTAGAELKEEIRESGSIKNPPLKFQLQDIDHEHAYLAERKISKETAEHFGVGFFPGKGSMSGRCVVPIHDERGELVAYAGRSIDGSEPRYKVPAGFHKSAVLYNLHRALSSGQRGLIVVEGFFDCMTISQAGYPFVVALMGSSLSEEQERLLVSNAEMVLVMLDGDAAGREGTDDCLQRLGRKVWTRSVSVPDGRQPDQLRPQELARLLGN